MKCSVCGAEMNPGEDFCWHCGAPGPPEVDRFAEARGRFDTLLLRYRTADIDAAQFQTERETLTLQDVEGRYWAPAEDGQWLLYDGSEWVFRKPPVTSDAQGPPPPPPMRESRGGWWLAIGGVLTICLLLTIYLIWRPGAPRSFGRGFLALDRQTPTPSVTPIPSPTEQTPTVMATPSQSPIAQFTASQAPEYVETAIPGAALLFADDFEDPASGWMSTTNEWADYGYLDGEYVIEVLQDDASAWASAPTDVSGDFWLEADVRQVSGMENQAFGLVFRREDDANFYYLAITETGQYVLFMRSEGEFRLVQGRKWASSETINGPGQVNRLAVACVDEQITLYVNGVALTSLEDATFRGSSIGLAASRDPAVDGLVVAFDNVCVYGLPEPEATRSVVQPSVLSFSADQQAVYNDFGPPHSFTIAAFDAADGSIIRHETWNYHDAGTCFVFVDGAYQYTEDAETVSGDLIAAPYEPRQFVMGETLEQVQARAPGQSWERLDWIDVALEGSQIYASRQLLVAFDETGLVLVEALAVLPEGGE